MAFDNRPKPHNTANYRANFLWPVKQGSIAEAGYEYANAKTEPYRKTWWRILKHRIKKESTARLEKALKDVQRNAHTMYMISRDPVMGAIDTIATEALEKKS